MSPHRRVTVHSPCEVRHLHHDHAHLFGDHDDVVAGVVPLGDFSVEAMLLRAERFNLGGDFGFFFLRYEPIRISSVGNAVDIRVLVQVVSRRFATSLIRVVLVFNLRLRVEFFRALRKASTRSFT